MDRKLLPEEGTRLSLRQRQILASVQEQGFATIDALAAQFEVSSQTVRRDIIKLQQANYLQRFHGGAGLADGAVRVGYAQKLTVAPDGKRRIGEALARMIPDDATVFLDVGTTVEAVARALLPKSGLRIITASVSVAMIFCSHGRQDVFVTGGTVRGANGALTGSAAAGSIEMFRFDWAVLGLGGFDDDGAPMDFDLEKIAVRRAAIARARRSVIVGDATKFEKAGVARVAPASAFHALVTDAEPPPALRDALQAAGVACVVA